MLTIVGHVTATRGIPIAETGINCKTFRVRFFPETNSRFKDYTGQTFIRSVSESFSRQIAVEGEITGTAGLMAFTLGFTLSFGNLVNVFGPVAGSILLDEATVSLDRDGWRSMSMQASSNPRV